MSDLALTDQHALALTLWGEARGESIEGRIAIAALIRNRKQTDRWGDTYRDVCLAKWQFSCWKEAGGKANYEAVQAMAHQLVNSETPDDVILRECIWIATGITGGWIRDTVHGATHYHVATMTPKPYWTKGQEPVCRIGAHVFYRGIR
jgi:spore germination cell wall hydrolase CwlJ-like protein